MKRHPMHGTLLSIAMTALLATTAHAQEDAPPAAEETTPSTTDPAKPTIREAVGTVEATEENVAQARTRLDQAAAQDREEWKNKTFEEFEAEVYREPIAGGKYIVNGDIAIADRKHLQEFFAQVKDELSGTAGGKLIVNQTGVNLSVNQVNGRDDVWNSAKRKQLRYCVSNTFATRHAAVSADMAAATATWEQAADVDFIHVTGEDATCTQDNNNVVFDVRPIDVEGEYLARAFFPADQRPARNVLIDQSSFEMNPSARLKLVGILRHELGHTLGWRHEHTRPESGTCFEDALWRPLTAYDAFSVMHYPHCNGGGDMSLVLTSADKAGSACVYGRGSQNTEDLGSCLNNPPSAPVAGAPTTQSFAAQAVTAGERRHYGPFLVKPGTVIDVAMTASGASPGDPDLYVRYVDKPTLSRWVCRPFLSGANETCELEVPLSRSEFFVMVNGFTAGNYGLSVSFVPKPQP